MKEPARSHFLSWLESALAATIPAEVVAFNVNLYDSPFWAEIVGSSYFDPDDEDWACDECWRPPEPNRFDFPESMAELHWEARLAMVTACIQDWLRSGLPAARKCLQSAAFAVGFVDGNLTLVHATQPIQPVGTPPPAEDPSESGLPRDQWPEEYFYVLTHYRHLIPGETDPTSDIIARTLHERHDQIVFNRCPFCNALARTPKARQCPKCHKRWD